MFLECRYYIHIFYAWLHVSDSQGHLHATHFFFMESTALCLLLPTVLVNVCPHYSQFWCFENVYSFFIFILRLFSVMCNICLLVRLSLILGLCYPCMPKCCIFVLTCPSECATPLVMSTLH
jgi:hypothetical protein